VSAARLLATARDLTLPQVASLVAWNAISAGRAAADRAGALRRAERDAARWAAAWCARWGPDDSAMRRWLARPGAGRLWLAPGEARAWATETCTPADVALADDAVRGVVDLLGSGPVQVGDEPTFRHDLYSGREWPLEPARAVRVSRGDGSDIRTLWEQSRFYHAIPLARAYWSTGDARYSDAFVRHARSWMRANPVGLGANWATPMDLALRAANWALACVLFADAPGIAPRFWGDVLANLRVTARYVRRHLEWHPVYRGNHLVANAVGLVYVGALFRDDTTGARWLAAGSRILHDEILYQVTEDGVGFEASLAYHRLDTDLFAWAAEVLRSDDPNGVGHEYDERLRRMYAFIDAYLPPSGLAPMLGDADDGRVHGTSAAGLLEPRAHREGLPARHWPSPADRGAAGSRAFPAGGFYVIRGGAGHCVVRCGPVGLKGAGSHDHCDVLSYELVLAGRRVVADSGTYAYTRDLQERFRFRATSAHSVVQLGAEEQNPISPGQPWRVLADRTRAECTEWDATADRTAFEGRHHGYAHRPSGAIVTRRIVAPARGDWTFHDAVGGTGTESLTWRLHLAPDVTVQTTPAGDGAYELAFGGAPAVRGRLTLPPGLRLTVDGSPISDRYGRRAERACLVADGTVALPAEITLTIGAVPA
jgi:hypothetical protein